MAKQNTQTKERPQQQQQGFAQEPQSKGQLAPLQPPRLPWHPDIQREFPSVDEGIWRAIVDAFFPSAKTIEGVRLALSYCRARKLDISKRLVHIVPIWNSALKREVETVWPGIGELRTTAHRTQIYAGADATVFGPLKEFTFTGQPEYYDREQGQKVKGKMETVKLTAPDWAQITLYRFVNDQRIAFPGPRIYFLENYGKKGKTDLPNDQWDRRPSYMLEKVAEAAALRKAFPEEVGDWETNDEIEGHTIDLGGGVEVITPTAPDRPTQAQFRKEATDADQGDDGQPDESKRQAASSSKNKAQSDSQGANVEAGANDGGEPVKQQSPAEGKQAEGGKGLDFYDPRTTTVETIPSITGWLDKMENIVATFPEPHDIWTSDNIESFNEGFTVVLRKAEDPASKPIIERLEKLKKHAVSIGVM
ncbi:MAG TPA: phage recombination protein Bet [Dongiaceae bacterium]|nr:phage recombination protein Bet [Dongiaceae bacterium]